MSDKQGHIPHQDVFVNRRWIFGLAAGGIAGKGGYFGYFGTLRILAEALPEAIVRMIRRSSHFLVIGGVISSAFYAYTLEASRHNQMRALSEFERAIALHPDVRSLQPKEWLKCS